VESEIAARLAGAPDAAIVQLLSRDAGAVRLHEALTKLASDGRDARDLAFDPYTPERAAALVDSLAASVRAFLGGPGARLAGIGARGKVTTRVLEELQCSLEALPDGRPVPLDTLDAAADAVRRSWSAEARKRLVLWSKGEFNQGESKFLGEDEPRARDLAGPLASALDVFRCMRPRLHDSARRTLAELLTRVRAELLAQGIETYTDLLRDARRLVLENPRVVARIRARVRQIVVDEFQDTDPTQCDLIRRIALDDLPGTQKPGLFLVGDPKQSIYGWRSADLAAYESFADEIVRCGGLRERLSVNYRSTRRILDEVERAMRPIMIAEAGLQPSFEPLVAARDVDGVPVERVVPWCLDASAPQSLGDTTKSDSRAIEADWIARDLASQREQGTPWRKMAILLRATGDLDVYLSARPFSCARSSIRATMWRWSRSCGRVSSASQMRR
jgi:superfamily I DNA/RNA helicase